MSPVQRFLLHNFFQATIVMKTAMTSTNPETGRRITIGSISLSCVSVVVAFDVLLTTVDCVVWDRTDTLLKNYKAEI